MRIDPNKVPHLVMKDNVSSAIKGQVRGIVPSQKTLSVQDVRDYSTPQGAAMANEDMRRLRLSVEAVKKEIEKTPSTEQVPISNTTNIAGNNSSTTIINEDGTIGDTTAVEGTSAYTVYHNNVVVGIIDKNKASNYIDGSFVGGKKYDVIFDVSNDNNTAKIKGSVNIPIDEDLWYMEKFVTNTFFSGKKHALFSDLDETGVKYGTTVYKDIKHMFNLKDKDDFVYSITQDVTNGKTTFLPIVRGLDRDTVRVYSSVRYDIDYEPKFVTGNTTLISRKNADDYIEKFPLPKFTIVIHSKNNAIFAIDIYVISGDKPGTIHDTYVNSGKPNTIHTNIINGGKP